jgi:hypothetical protein
VTYLLIHVLQLLLHVDVLRRDRLVERLIQPVFLPVRIFRQTQLLPQLFNLLLQVDSHIDLRLAEVDLALQMVDLNFLVGQVDLLGRL